MLASIAASLKSEDPLVSSLIVPRAARFVGVVASKVQQLSPCLFCLSAVSSLSLSLSDCLIGRARGGTGREEPNATLTEAAHHRGSTRSKGIFPPSLLSPLSSLSLVPFCTLCHSRSHHSSLHRSQRSLVLLRSVLLIMAGLSYSQQVSLHHIWTLSMQSPRLDYALYTH